MTRSPPLPPNAHVTSRTTLRTQSPSSRRSGYVKRVNAGARTVVVCWDPPEGGGPPEEQEVSCYALRVRHQLRFQWNRSEHGGPGQVRGGAYTCLCSDANFYSKHLAAPQCPLI